MIENIAASEQSPEAVVALVTPGYERGGGLPAVADFLSTALGRVGGFTTQIISPTVCWNDPLNTCVVRPRSWVRGPVAEKIPVHGQTVTRVGAWWAEAEFMRYRPRRGLDQAVGGADLVQVVCGSAVSAFALRRVQKPLFIQVATTLRVERELGRRASSRSLVTWAMTRLCEPMERAALRRADGVFVENQWMHDRLAATLQPGRLHFAPPGTDTDFFHPDSGVTRDCLLFVGRLGDPRKNVRLLLEAYRAIRAAQPDAPPLVLAGGMKPTDSDLKFIAESGLMSFVEIVSNPDRLALAALYRRCRVFMLASHEEGFGIVLIEAMASGAPVVSTDCGGPRAIVEEGKNGFLVPVGDSAVLAERVVRLLRDNLLRETMGRCAQSRAQTTFSLEVCGRRFAAVYRKAMEARVHPAG